MSRELVLGTGRIRFAVDVHSEGAKVTLESGAHELVFEETAPGRLVIQNSAGRYPARVVRDGDRLLVWLAGKNFEFHVPSADNALDEGGTATHDEVRAPMPGTILKILVAAGDAVEENQTVAILEAMKMEHNLRAPRNGTVETVGGEPGEIVDAGTAIVKLSAE